MKAAKFIPQLVRMARRHRIKKLPEARTVIHFFFRMCQLVKNHIVHQMRRHQHQITRQADSLCRRTAPPSGTRSRNPHLTVSKPVTSRPLAYQRRKDFGRRFLQCTKNGDRAQVSALPSKKSRYRADNRFSFRRNPSDGP